MTKILSTHPTSCRLTGAELLALKPRIAAGEVLIDVLVVGFSEITGYSKDGKRRTRHVQSGYTATLTWPGDQKQAETGPEPDKCCPWCVWDGHNRATLPATASGHGSAPSQVQPAADARGAGQPTGRAAGAQEELPW